MAGFVVTHVCYYVLKYLTTILKYISTNLFELYISAAGRIMSIGFMFDSELLAREITDSCKYHPLQDPTLWRVGKFFANTQTSKVGNLLQKAEVKSQLPYLGL